MIRLIPSNYNVTLKITEKDLMQFNISYFNENNCSNWFYVSVNKS